MTSWNPALTWLCLVATACGMYLYFCMGRSVRTLVQES